MTKWYHTGIWGLFTVIWVVLLRAYLEVSDVLVTSILMIAVYVLKVLFALEVIFISRKSPSSTWAWLFVFFFLPIIGFVLYLLLGRNLNAITKKHAPLIQMNFNYNHAMLSAHNDVTILAEGNEKFTSVILDILNAKESIHIQYYIYKMDDTGRSIYNALVQKAKEGVEVKMIYDDLGSRKLRELTDAGGEFVAFF